MPFLGGCYTVQWSDIANSCCVIVWNMRSSQYTTIFSSQGLNWASIHWSCFSVSAAICVKLFLTHEVQKQGLRWAMPGAVAKSSICDLRLMLESISSSCFCFLPIPQCLDCGKKTSQVRQRRMGASLCQTWNFCCYYKENGTFCNESAGALQTTALLDFFFFQVWWGSRCKGTFPKKQTLALNASCCRELCTFWNFFFENICFPHGVTSWTVFTFSILFIVTSVSIFIVML